MNLGIKLFNMNQAAKVQNTVAFGNKTQPAYNKDHYDPNAGDSFSHPSDHIPPQRRSEYDDEFIPADVEIVSTRATREFTPSAKKTETTDENPYSTKGKDIYTEDDFTPSTRDEDHFCKGECK